MRKFYDLDVERLEVIHGQVMVPIDSPWVISYSTSIDPIIVSVTIFEIFDV